MSRGVAALLGTGLVMAWILGLIFDAPAWLVWCDVGLALVALGGLASAGSPGLEGAATWPFVTLGLGAVWLFALATGAPAWLTWLNFVFGCGFLIVTVTLLVPRIDPVHLPHRGRS